jgi:hypothetical protein
MAWEAGMIDFDDLSVKKLAFILFCVVFVIYLLINAFSKYAFVKHAENSKRKLNRIANGTEKLVVGSILIGLFQDSKDALYLATIFAIMLIYLEFFLDE